MGITILEMGYSTALESKMNLSGLQKAILVYIMSKIKFPRQHPRSIVQRRHDHPSSLFISIPRRMVKQWDLQPGQIVEFSTLVEGQDTFLKVKKVV